MTEASRTAVLVCQARAVADGRIAVGRFADPVAFDLLDDAERAPVRQARIGEPDGWRDRIVYEFLMSTVDILVTRSVAIDDAVRTARHPQLVVLGAGLDSRAWRMPELTRTSAFEVDHPASQTEKRRRVGDLTPSASSVTFVPVSFGDDDLGAALRGAGHDLQRPTTWIWEGVFPYLTAVQVRTTLSELAAASPTGSTLIVTYPTEHRVGRLLHLGLKALFRAARRPNPMSSERHVSTWTPGQMARLLADHGFTVESDRGQDEIAAELGFAPHRPEAMRRGRVVVAKR